MSRQRIAQLEEAVLDCLDIIEDTPNLDHGYDSDIAAQQAVNNAVGDIFEKLEAVTGLRDEKLRSPAARLRAKNWRQTARAEVGRKAQAKRV